jgi:hypothetical protein
MMSLSLERFYPLAVALLIGFVSFKACVPFPGDEKEFIAAALSLGAVLTGFIATAQAILMALPSDSVMGRLRSTGYIDDLIRYIAEALYAGVIYCIVNVAGFYLLKEKPHFEIYSAVWIGTFIYSILSFIRVARLMMRIMRSP